MSSYFKIWVGLSTLYLKKKKVFSKRKLPLAEADVIILTWLPKLAKSHYKENFYNKDCQVPVDDLLICNT